MFTKLKYSKSLGIAVILLAGVGSVQANEDISVSAGLRFWSSQWQANTFPVIGGSQIAAHADSDSRIAVIPVISVRYKDFGVSASKFMENTYTLTDGIQVPFSAKRSESDINFSYSILPGLSASIGAKEIKWESVVISGPTLGLTGGASIGSGFGLYGTGGFGMMNTKIQGASDLATDYMLGEFGLSYSFDGVQSTALKGLSATLGYRFQKITAKGSAAVNGRDIVDITSGLTMGLIARF